MFFRLRPICAVFSLIAPCLWLLLLPGCHGKKNAALVAAWDVEIEQINMFGIDFRQSTRSDDVITSAQVDSLSKKPLALNGETASASFQVNLDLSSNEVQGLKGNLEAEARAQVCQLLASLSKFNRQYYNSSANPADASSSQDASVANAALTPPSAVEYGLGWTDGQWAMIKVWMRFFDDGAIEVDEIQTEHRTKFLDIIQKMSDLEWSQTAMDQLDCTNLDADANASRSTSTPPTPATPATPASTSSATPRITFTDNEPNTKECEFGKMSGGVLAQYLHAGPKQLDLVSGEVKSMRFESAGHVLYDDDFFISFGATSGPQKGKYVVVATSQYFKSSPAGDTDRLIFSYEGDGDFGAKFGGLKQLNGRTPFIMGGAVGGKFPDYDSGDYRYHGGSLSFELKGDQFVALFETGGLLADQDSINVLLTTTGDDNGSKDCSHIGFDFEVNLDR